MQRSDHTETDALVGLAQQEANEADDALLSNPPQRLRDIGLALLVVALCVATLVLAPAHAAQTLDVRDGDTTITRISLRDQTRLRAERARVLDVIGDVFDAQKNPGGRIVVLKDEAEGEVYLKPVPPAAMRGPDGALLPGLPAGPVTAIKLDVKTDRGTVGLLLQPADVVGDTLTLRVSGGEAKAQRADARAKSNVHLRAAKALTLAMAAPGLSGEVPAQRMPAGGKELALWKEARFALMARYEVPGLVGETYELTNISSARMVIDERELFRPGVVSIGLRQLVLEPGGRTDVWIVRQADDQD